MSTALQQIIAKLTTER